MYGTFIKEMDRVKEYMNIHPMTTLLTDEELKISSVVNIGVQNTLLLDGYLSQPVVGG